MLRITLSLILTLTVSAVLLAAPPGPEETWPGFRGHRLSGVAPGDRVPERWSVTDNVRWKIDVPGRGWSSPIVWGDTLFVTSAINGKPFKQPTPGLYGNDYIAEMRAQGLPADEINRRVRARDNETSEEAEEIRYMVYAVDAATGKLKWEREASPPVPHGGRHRKNTYASETPFTDGERRVRVVRPERRVVLLLADRRSVVEEGMAAAAHLPRLRHGLVADRARRADLPPARQRARVVPDGAGCEDGAGAVADDAAEYGPAEVVLDDAVRVAERTAHRDRHHGTRDGDFVRPRRRRAVAGQWHVDADGGAFCGERPAVCRHRIAGGREPTLHGDPAGRERGHHPEGDRGQQRVHRLAASARVRVYAVRPGASRPRLPRARHRHHGRARRDVGEGDLQGPHRRWRAHVLGVAGGSRRSHPAAHRGRDDVRDRGRGRYREIARNDLAEMSLASPAIAGGAVYVRTETKLYKIQSAR